MKSPPGTPRRGPRRVRAPALSNLLGVAVVVTVLYFARPFFIPIVLATLLAFILAPLVAAAERLRIGRVAAVLMVVVGATLAVLATAWLLGSQMMSLAEDLPLHRAEIEAKLSGVRGIGSDGLGRFFALLRDLDAGHAVTAATAPVALAPAAPIGELPRLTDFVPAALDNVATAFLVLLLVVFMLLRREDLRNRAIGLLGRGRIIGTTRATVMTAQRISRFLLAQLAVNVGLGVTFGLGLALLGVPYPIVWGFTAMVLRFIPYIGIIVAAAAPILIVVATSPGWGLPIAVAAFILVVELVTGNVIEPIVFSRRTGVSPFALLVAAVFWTWLWGLPGLLLSTPITVCLVVLGQHARPLRFLWVLLGDEAVLVPPAAFYQRLLAGDEVEALAVATAHAELHGPTKAFDEVLVPALRRARRDHDRGVVDAAHEALVEGATARVVDRLAPPPVADAVPALAPGGRVVLCPAHRKADELACTMLARAMPGVRCELVSSRDLASDIVKRIAADPPELVVIAVVPPGGLVQAASLCRRLRSAAPGVRIVVAHMRQSPDYDGLLVRLRKSGASYLATSLVQTVSQATSLIAPSPP
ncbi:MAG: AI-2E family transporter [Myxococcota bacterium]